MTYLNGGYVLIDLDNLSLKADSIEDLINFDDFIIDKKLFDKFFLNKAIYLNTLLYDDVKYNGFINEPSETTPENALCETQFNVYYYDYTDKAMCYFALGQLKDGRYYLICSNTTIS